MIADLRAIIRGGVSRTLPAFLEMNEARELLVAQGNAPGLEVSRRGQRYATMATAAVAGLVIRPTTVAALEIYNNTGRAGIGPRAMAFERIFTQWLVSTNVVEDAILYAMVTLPKDPPTDAALAINSLSGRPALTKDVITAAGTTVVDNGWFPYGLPHTHAAGGVTPMGGIEAIVAARLLVPPGCSLCLHVLSSVVGDTFTNGGEWAFAPVSMAE